MTTVERRGPGRPKLTPEQEYDSLRERWWSYTDWVNKESDCRIKADKARHRITRSNGQKMSLTKLGWLFENTTLKAIPDWYDDMVIVKMCMTRGCVSGLCYMASGIPLTDETVTFPRVIW